MQDATIRFNDVVDQFHVVLCVGLLGAGNDAFRDEVLLNLMKALALLPDPFNQCIYILRIKPDLAVL